MLIFQNDGVIPIESFTTFGMSAKPGSRNPIGKFGTGLKNAVAIILRLGGTITVWRGSEEYVFYTKTEDFRGTEFEKVRMKKRKGIAPWKYEALPFTTKLGQHWEPWMAFRELEANTRDESNGKTIFSESDIYYEPQWDRTHIVVECAELDDAYRDIDKIFLPEDKAPIFEDSSVRVFEGSNNHIFYRGMRVTTTSKPTLYTYDLKTVVLTEDRTSQYTFLDNNNIRDALLACEKLDLAMNVVKNSKDRHEGGFDWDVVRKKVGAGWGMALSSGGLSSRFTALRDNLEFGIAENQDVSIDLSVGEWIKVMRDVKDEKVLTSIREQLVEAGWKPSANWNEIAEVADDNVG